MLDASAAWWHRIDAAAIALHEGAAPLLPALGIIALPLGMIFASPLVMWWLGPPEEPFRWPRGSRWWWGDLFSGKGGGRSEAPGPDVGSGDPGDWI